MKHNIQQLKLVMTGGHLTPAVSTIVALEQMHPNVTIQFIGRRFVFEGSDVLSHEEETMNELGVSFVPLVTGRFTSYGSLHNVLVSWIKIPIGICMAFWYLVRFRPDVVVSFGGYIAFPVAIAAWCLDIPILTHEQTQRVGLGTKIISMLSSVVCVSNREHMPLFWFVRCVYTGLPLRTLIVKAAAIKHGKRVVHHHRPVILITGGTTGATSINTIVYQILPQLLSIATIVHQVGRSSMNEARRMRNSLTEKEKRGYKIVEYMSETEYVNELRRADIIIGRSGANTVHEIAALAKSAIFIPLPWAAYDEQYKNASLLESAGSASIIRQKDVSSAVLILNVKEHILHKDLYEKNALAYASSIPLDAAEILSREIIMLAGSL